MSGVNTPWDPPIEVCTEHNNGREGLSPAGHKAYDKWQRALKQWCQRLTNSLATLKDRPAAN